MLGRRALKPIRAVIAAPGSIVDPAVDVKNSDLEAYWESLFDPQYINFLPGETPTWLTIQQLTRRQKEFSDALDGRKKAAFYLRASLLSIENYSIIDSDGNEMSAPPLDRKKRGEHGVLASDECIDRLDLPIEHLTVIFLMISKISEASLPLSAQSGLHVGPE